MQPIAQTAEHLQQALTTDPHPIKSPETRNSNANDPIPVTALPDEFPDDCPECGGRTKFREVVTVYYPQDEWSARGKMYDAFYCRHIWHRLKESAERTSAMFSISGLAPQELALTLDNILERGAGSSEMITVAKSVLAGKRYFATFWGGSGNGKTQTLIVLVNEFLRQGHTAIYARLSNLLNHLRDGFGDDSYRTSERYRQIINAHFLAIDEPDKINYTNWAREIFFTLIDDRYKAAKLRQHTTTIAMNDDPETLPAYVISRLRYDLHADTGFAIVHNTDPDGRESGL